MYLRKRLYWISFAIILILILMLTGCGDSSNAGDSPDGGGSSDAPSSVTITWWSHNNPDFVEANKKLIADFNKDYPNIKIDYQYFPYDAMSPKLKASYAAHTESDVQQVFGTWATYYASHGWLEPIPVEPVQLENEFFEAALGAYEYNGQYYGIPHEYNLENGGILAYPKMFQEAGITDYPPKTWEDLITAAQKLTKTDNEGNIVRFGFDFTSSDNIPFLFLSLILQQEGEYWENDGVHVTFTTPEATQAMQAMADLIIEYKVTDMKHFNQPDNDISDLFFKGQSAMTFRGPWTIAKGLNQYEVKDFDYIPMPSFTDNPPYFAAESGWGEIISANSKHKDETWKFVQFITSKESSLYFNQRTFTVPARKDVAKDPKFIEQIPLMKPSLDVLDYGRWIGPLQDVDQFKQIVCTHFQRIVDNKEQIETALKAIEEETNKMIDEQLK